MSKQPSKRSRSTGTKNTRKKPSQQPHKPERQSIDEKSVRYREIFQNAPDCMTLIDVNPDGRFKFVELNRAEEKATGVSSAEVAGKYIEDVFPPEAAVKMAALWSHCVETGEVMDYDEAPDLPAGEGRFHTVLVPIRRQDGRIHRLLGIVRGISEQKRAEVSVRESEARFRAAFENANEGVCLVDLTGRFLRVNAALCAMLGYTREELESMSFTDITHADDRQQSDEARLFAAGEASGKVRFDKRYLTRDGRVVWVNVSTSLLRDAAGEPVHFITHVQNITERKTAELALRESEERYRTLIMHSPDAIYVHVDGCVTFANPAMCRLLGAEDPSQLMGRSVFAIVHPAFHDLVRGRWHEVFGGAAVPLIDEQFLRLDETAVDVEVNAVAIGTPERHEVQVIARDITERKKIEAALRRSEAELKESQRVAGLGSWEWDAVSDRVTVSEEFQQLYGGNLVQTRSAYGEYLKAFTPVSASILAAATEQSLKTGAPYELDLELAWTGGARRWITARGEVIRDHQGRIVGLRGTSQDISARKRVEEELRMLSHVVEQSPLSVIVSDPDGVIEYVNPKFTESTGFTAGETIGKTIGILMSGEINPEEYRALWASIGSGQEWRGEFHSRNRNGELFWEAASISPVRSESGIVAHFVAIKEDITERKKAELALRASLDEKNTLLKEVHHRVKNNLQVISSLLSLQADQIADPSLKKAFRESQHRIRSMAMVHEQLYRSERFAGIDFRRYLSEVTGTLLDSSLYRGIACRISMEAMWLDIDRAIPCGLIVNELVTNALKHAFRGRETGQIEIRMQRSSPREVELVVEDDGVGIPPDIDFRTSMSMGLMIVRTLVEQLEGTVELKRRTGTRWVIRFPVEEGDAPPTDGTAKA